MADRVRFELFCSVSVSGNLEESLKVMMAGILVFEGDDGGRNFVFSLSFIDHPPL